MRVLYDRPKGKRIKKGSSKVMWNDQVRKVDNFFGLTHCVRLNENLLDWDIDCQKWVNIDDCISIRTSSYNTNIKNLKQAIRHMKKHDEIPKGTKFILESNFKGYDIVIIK